VTLFQEKSIKGSLPIVEPMRYEVLEHTADIMIRTSGKDLAECFANAAYALEDQMVRAELIETKELVEFDVEGFDVEALLLNFLTEFLFLIDTRRLVFNRFDIKIDDLKLHCSAWGEIIDVERHEAKKEIKAITYHMMKVDPEEPSVQVIFDI
jgi:SHS2 domain-containing protein